MKVSSLPEDRRCRRALPIRRHFLDALVLAALLGICAPASGEQEAALGDWRSARAQLDARGVGFNLFYTGEQDAVLSGGKHAASTYLGLAEATFSLDGERLAGWSGATAFVHLIRPHGGNPSIDVGDAQGISNIAASARGRILEAWLQQNLIDDRLSLLAGRYDLNSEFYLLQSAGLFLNSSFGIGPEFSQTGVAGPSIYPDTAIAARVEARPAVGFALRGAVINGVPVGVTRPDGGSGIRRSGDGVLLVGEASYMWSADDAETRGSPHRRAGRSTTEVRHDAKIALGVWRYRATFDDLIRTEPDGAPVRHDGSGGAYLVGEQTVYRDPAHPQRRLRVFGQLGVGDADVARFAGYIGAGITLNAPLASRPNDEVGLAVASARNGSPYMESVRRDGQSVDRAETAIELTWFAQIRDWLTLQPGLQYVINPDTDPQLRNATVALLRFAVSL